MFCKAGVLVKNELYSRALSVLPFIRHLRPDEQELFRSHMVYVEFRDNEFLSTNTDECDQALFLLKGAVRVYKISEEGREVTLYRLQPGDTCLITLSCLMGLKELDTNAEIQAGSEGIKLPGSVFQILLKSNTHLMNYMMERTFTRLNQVMRVVELVTFSPLKKRIALFLRDEQNKHQKSLLKLTKEKIALEVGTAREVVSRVLGEFEREKLVKLGRGTLQLLDEKYFKEIDDL